MMKAELGQSLCEQRGRDEVGVIKVIQSMRKLGNGGRK